MGFTNHSSTLSGLKSFHVALFRFREIHEKHKKALPQGDAGPVSHTARGKGDFQRIKPTSRPRPPLRPAPAPLQPARPPAARHGLPTRVPRGRPNAEGSKMAAGQPAAPRLQPSGLPAARLCPPGLAPTNLDPLPNPAHRRPQPLWARRAPATRSSPWWRRRSVSCSRPTPPQPRPEKEGRVTLSSLQATSFRTRPTAYCRAGRSAPDPGHAPSPFAYSTTGGAEPSPSGRLSLAQPPPQLGDSFLAEGFGVMGQPVLQKL